MFAFLFCLMFYGEPTSITFQVKCRPDAHYVLKMDNQVIQPGQKYTFPLLAPKKFKISITYLYGVDEVTDEFEYIPQPGSKATGVIDIKDAVPAFIST